MGNVRPGGREHKRRRASAEERQAARATRGDAGQLAKLEKQGHSHCKEAKRLRARLGNSGSARVFASKAEERRFNAQQAGK